MDETLSLTEHVERILEEWGKTVVDVREAIAREDFESAGRTHILRGIDGAGNYINDAGFDHLSKAAELLLQKEQTEFRYSIGTARDALEQSLNADLASAKAKGAFST